MTRIVLSNPPEPAEITQGRQISPEQIVKKARGQMTLAELQAEVERLATIIAALVKRHGI
jgi:hypothetical protein